MGELRFLNMCDIHHGGFTIKVVAGKGNKDRFTILPKSILDLLARYYYLHKPGYLGKS
ncbi:MAG: hypothetical protein M3512_08005 [Bacteroidota bacterium]|nr:hypothetical protein [Bacteroidota bacterium]